MLAQITTVKDLWKLAELEESGVPREQGTDGLRAMLSEALPFVLAALAGNGHVVLVHADAPCGPTAAAAIACAALVAHGASSTDLGVDGAVQRLEEIRPASALHAAAIAQLRASEAWLRAGAPAAVAGDAAVDVADDDLGAADAPSAPLEQAAEMLDQLVVAPAAKIPQPDADAGAAGALHRAGERAQAEMLASLPAPDDESDDDDDLGDYAG